MRILIIGASGSGTTTLGEVISSEYRWGFFDVDNYYWLPTTPPFKKKRNHSKRLEIILNDLNQFDNSVVSGSIMNWGQDLEDSFELIVFLYLDSDIRVERIKNREKLRFGSVNPDFLKWASEYDTGPSEGRSLERHNIWLGKRSCKVIRLEGDLSINERLEVVSSALAYIR